MPFQWYFESIFDILMMHHNNIIVMAVYLLLHVLVVVLRFIIYVGARGHNVLINNDLNPTKSLKNLTDTNNIKSPILRRIVGDYIAVAEKNAPRVPVKAIVDKHVLGMSFLGLRYININNWTAKMENGLAIVGIILMLIFSQYVMVYGLLAVAGFIGLKLVSSLFDYEIAQKLLIGDINIYLEREVGQFFAGHVNSAILRFKEEVANVIEQQSAQLTCLEGLPKAMQTMQQSNDRYALHHESFIAQAKIIKDTQTALEESLTAYETTLQDLVQNMGSGLGVFVEMHGKNAANNLNEAVQKSIERMTLSNQEMINAITVLMQQASSQSKDISTHLRILHERVNEME